MFYFKLKLSADEYTGDTNTEVLVKRKCVACKREFQGVEAYDNYNKMTCIIEIETLKSRYKVRALGYLVDFAGCKLSWGCICCVPIMNIKSKHCNVDVKNGGVAMLRPKDLLNI